MRRSLRGEIVLPTVRVSYLSKIVNRVVLSSTEVSSVIPKKKDVILGGSNLLW